MSTEALEQYNRALKEGQKFYKNALAHGEYPYPPVLDELMGPSPAVSTVELGLVDLPSELVTGTRTAGRTSALAGNFMPLLPATSEFAAKWINLYDAQLSDEGIRDPVKCYEYLGRFYIQEGNKRCSVLKALSSPTIPGLVTRVVPAWSEDEAIQVYYEFMRFYELARLYGVVFRRRGDYARLQAALGLGPDQVWSEEERRSFLAGFTQFRRAFDTLARGREDVTAAEALLCWLEVFPFDHIKTLGETELGRALAELWPDVETLAGDSPIQLQTEPDLHDKGFLSKLMGKPLPGHLNVAFLYAFDPHVSPWTRSHDVGRQDLVKALGDRVTVTVYRAYDHNYLRAMETAVAQGAQVIFATTPDMIGACRHIAARHSGVKVLNCALFQPYHGVRMYYSRLHECKFITGAIAGAMAENDRVGYVANYPIFGVPASINAFALGVRLTNPRARVRLAWSCTPGDPLRELMDSGATVISNRDAADPNYAHWAMERVTYKLGPHGEALPLAAPCWNWGKLYEQILLSIFNGSWDDLPADRAVNYWWGMDSGVIDVQFSPSLPDGVRSLALLLKNGIIEGSVSPFRTRILDQNGIQRWDGSLAPSAQELLSMDWLCDNVEGSIPPFDRLLRQSQETVRLLGLYRDQLPPPEKEGGQL